jgi:hypothetical protein
MVVFSVHSLLFFYFKNKGKRDFFCFELNEQRARAAIALAFQPLNPLIPAVVLYEKYKDNHI